jgi:hypothetical protein
MQHDHVRRVGNGAFFRNVAFNLRRPPTVPASPQGQTVRKFQGLGRRACAKIIGTALSPHPASGTYSASVAGAAFRHPPAWFSRWASNSLARQLLTSPVLKHLIDSSIIRIFLPESFFAMLSSNRRWCFQKVPPSRLPDVIWTGRPC